MMKRSLICSMLLTAVFCETVVAQYNSSGTDKYILLTTPYNKRALNLYKGQLQINTGYKFAVRSQQFDNSGELTSLKDIGTGSVFHYYFGELRYGLTDYLELGAETNFLRRGIREPTVTVVNVTTAATERITINKLTESRGMGDIFLFSSLRLPIEYRWFDFAVKAGVFVPSASFRPAPPSNNVEAASLASTSYTINLKYTNRNGYGVPVWLAAAKGKLTLDHLVLAAEWSIRDPLREGESLRWTETMTDKTFSYYDKSYTYLLSKTITFDISAHYQATGWFNIFLNMSSFGSKGGWTEYNGNKYSNPERRLLNIEPGFELQISPMLTVYQAAGFPLSGKNADAPFWLFTTLSFNIIPFRR
jgi:hypothetical protein